VEESLEADHVGGAEISLAGKLVGDAVGEEELEGCVGELGDALAPDTVAVGLCRTGRTLACSQYGQKQQDIRGQT